MKTRLKFTETQFKENVIIGLFGFEIKVDLCFRVRENKGETSFLPGITWKEVAVRQWSVSPAISQVKEQEGRAPSCTSGGSG